MNSPSRFPLVAAFAFFLGLSSVVAAPEFYWNFDKDSSPQVSGGGEAMPSAPDPLVQPPAIKEEAGRGKIAVFSEVAQKLAFDGNLDATKPMTVAMVVRMDGDPGGADAQRWLFTTSTSPFRDAFRLLWRGSNLMLETGPNFNAKEENALVVKFGDEEINAAKGKWLFIAFSTLEDGRAWGCVGDLASPTPLLREATKLGEGQLATKRAGSFFFGGQAGKSDGDASQFSIDQVAIFNKGLSPEDLAGLFNAVKSGQSLEAKFTPISTAALGALTADAKKDVHEPQQNVVDTPKMRIEFDDGWLVRWENKETGEKMEFGKPALSRASNDDRFYIPGPWWVDWKQPSNLEATGTQWQAAAKAIDDSTVEFTESAQRTNGREIHGLQWAVNIPYDQVDSIRIPDHLAPERMAGPGALDQAVLFKPWQMGGRLGTIAPRLRFFLIHGKTGGLLIYLDDPKFEHFLVREYKKTEGDLIISNRSVSEPPWKDAYTSGKWVFRQYQGGVNVAAQIYQDHLQKTLKIKPLAERPTAWVEQLSYAFVGGPWAEPLPLPGKRRPEFNYSNNWDESKRASKQWLENAAKVLDPAKTLFYISGWRYSPGVDSSWPDHSIDPFFAQVVGPARRMGYHVMLHYCNIQVNAPTEFFDRYLKNQSKLLGLDYIQGFGRDALRNENLHSKDDGVFGGPRWGQGVTGTQENYNMNFAFEGWRKMFISSILSAVRATGADSVHLDVPDFWLDANNARYGMTCQQGLGLYFKELRETLDENGLEHVAIATEGLPHEICLPYVDMSQMARDKTIDLLFTGFYGLPDMFGRFDTKQVADLMKARAEQEALAKEKKFDPAVFRDYVSKVRELGEPSVKTLVTGKFLRPYPHLGAFAQWSPGEPSDPNRMVHNRAFQALRIWYAMSVNDVLYESGAARGMFSDVAPYDELESIRIYRKWMKDDLKTRYSGKVLNDIDYGKLALARFWQDTSPIPMEPAKLQKGDINRYTLKDGRTMFTTRSAPTTLRWQFGDGAVLAELDIFEGWKNDKLLIGKYAPHFLDDQLDAPAPSVK